MEKRTEQNLRKLYKGALWIMAKWQSMIHKHGPRAKMTAQEILRKMQKRNENLSTDNLENEDE